MNVYVFTGRLARDCETRVTPSGLSICSFTVAVDYGYGENKGTNWIRCSLFGKRAEGGLPQYLLKGTQVAVSGELKVSEYDNKDGNKQTSIDVSVDKLDLIGSKQDSAPQNAPQHQSAAPQQPSNNSHDPFDDVPADDDIPF